MPYTANLFNLRKIHRLFQDRKQNEFGEEKYNNVNNDYKAKESVLGKNSKIGFNLF